MSSSKHQQGHRSHRRASATKPTSKHHHGSSSKTETSQLRTSFLFIVNDLEANDNRYESGSVEPHFADGRWRPPTSPQGFKRPVVGDIYRWEDGIVSRAADYSWSSVPQLNANQEYYASGTINYLNHSAYEQPEYYRGVTVFYCNDSDGLYAACDDVSVRNIETCSDPIFYGWHPLTFVHGNNISYAVQAGDQDKVLARHASWIDQVVPEIYRPRHGPSGGRLSGYLPLIIALMAFSCADKQTLSSVFLQWQSWRSYRWQSHGYPNGRISQRGMTVSVYTDPENPEGSTTDSLWALENGPNPIFRR